MLEIQIKINIFFVILPGNSPEVVLEVLRYERGETDETEEDEDGAEQVGNPDLVGEKAFGDLENRHI